MKINVITMSEIDHYLEDQYYNDSIDDAKSLVEEFKSKHMLGYNIKKGGITIGDHINSFEFYDFLNSKYTDANNASINLLKYAIKDTQSRVKI